MKIRKDLADVWCSWEDPTVTPCPLCARRGLTEFVTIHDAGPVTLEPIVPHGEGLVHFDKRRRNVWCRLCNGAISVKYEATGKSAGQFEVLAHFRVEREGTKHV